MQTYVKISTDLAYRLIGHGPLVLVSTCSKDGLLDIAPIAWNCPVNYGPTRVLLAMDQAHQTCRNIRGAKNFIVCIPTADQVQLVKNTGSVSGRKVDKFAKFKIRAFKGKKVKAGIPEGCLGFIECKLLKMIRLGDVALVVGEYLYAAADKKAFKKRILSEKAAGKTLHHLGGKVFATLADKIL